MLKTPCKYCDEDPFANLISDPALRDAFRRAIHDHHPEPLEEEDAKC